MPYLKPLPKKRFHKLLKAKDKAKISLNQVSSFIKETEEKIMGCTGDDIEKLNSFWPCFLKENGFIWKIENDAGYLEADQIFISWIEQVYQSGYILESMFLLLESEILTSR